MYDGIYVKLIVDGAKKARRLAREKKYDTKKEQNDSTMRARRRISATEDKLGEIPIRSLI